MTYCGVKGQLIEANGALVKHPHLASEKVGPPLAKAVMDMIQYV
jgi:hypothetical protein